MITNEGAKNRAHEICAHLRKIDKTKEERTNLAKQLKQAEENQLIELVNQLSKKNGLLALSLREMNKTVRDLKQKLARDIAASERSFALLDEVSLINGELADQINALFMQHRTFNRKLAAEIRTHYGLDDLYNLNVLAKESGATTGFIVKINGYTLYIKESLSYHENKKINPKELFIYKLLEHVRLGPKTEFILHSFSTSRTGANICYISTRDVAYSKKAEKNKSFSSDNSEEYEKIGILDEKIEQCLQAFEDESFKIELLALSILEDIFYLNDGLKTNPNNYGIVCVIDGEQCKYKPKLIDHLPDCPNMPFEYLTIGYAVQSLQNKIRINKERHDRQNRQPPVFFTTFERKQKCVQNCFNDGEILQAYHRLISGKPGKMNSALLTAMQRAQEDINDLIDQFGDSFLEDAKKVLSEYCGRVQHNIERVQQLLVSTENPSKIFTQ